MSAVQMLLFDEDQPLPMRLVPLPLLSPKRRGRDTTIPLWDAAPKAFAHSDRRAWREAKKQAELRRAVAREIRLQAVSDEELLAALTSAIRAAVSQHAWGWRDKEELRAEVLGQIFRRARRWQPGRGKTLQEYCFRLATMTIYTLADREAKRPKIDPDTCAEWLAANETDEHCEADADELDG